MEWVVVGTAGFGAPRFCVFLWKNALFSRVLARNRGAPKTAVPTTTRPIPHLTPSDLYSYSAEMPKMTLLDQQRAARCVGQNANLPNGSYPFETHN